MSAVEFYKYGGVTPIDIYIADAFTSLRFLGNPAAVCIVNEAIDTLKMQQIAAEMNLSETAFLQKISGNDYSLRWFTPLAEVDLCGHATLASAHLLWELGHIKQDQIAHFHTKSGLLTAKLTEDWIALNFPSEPDQPCLEPSPFLLESLEVTTLYIGKNRFDYLVEVASEEIVKNLKPNFSLLQQVDCRGVIVTSIADNYLRGGDSSEGGNDFVSRCFFPRFGVNEDPVTGSAHCCLGPYWSRKLSKKSLIATQLSHRQGLIKVEMVEDRVILSGQAVTVMKGIINFQ